MDQESDTLKEKIINILRTSDELVYSFRKQIENKRTVIFIGLTKSGKTTLVKYLTNRPSLTAFQQGKYFKIKDESSSSEIGHSSVSHTTVPSVYEWDSDTIFIDAPGFEDNRGVLQEIENSLYINQIKYAREVKFVLVSDINNIKNDNINNFLNFVQTVQTILTNFDQLKRGVAIIFTKDGENCTRQEIADMLRWKILEDDNLKCEKSLIKHIVDHIELIGLFKMPAVEGVLRDEIDDHIKDAIFRTGTINLNVYEIKYSISTSANNFLLESYLSFHALVETIEAKLNDFNKITLNRFKEILREEFLISVSNSKLVESERILQSFRGNIKQFESSRNVANIPSGLKSIFIDEVCIILKQLESNPVVEINIVNEESIEEISRKIEYVICIESVIDMSYKTSNILKLYNETLNELYKETATICRMVQNEMDMRKEITNIVLKLLESEAVLLQLDQEYFSASTSDELLTIKIQLEGLLTLCEHFIQEMSKRSMFTENLMLEKCRLVLITQISKTKLILNNAIKEAQNNNSFLSVAKKKAFNKYERLLQLRLMSKSTILDEYLKTLPSVCFGPERLKRCDEHF